MRPIRIALAGVVVILAVALIAYGAGLAAVEGKHLPTGNVGYLGWANSGVRGEGSGAGAGVVGISTSKDGIAGLSSAAASSGFAGVYGESNACPGVVGKSGTSMGVWGYTLGTIEAPEGVGVRGDAVNGGVGIYGYAPTTGWAGFFEGDVHVTGSISTGGATAQIDDPVDPANRVLTLGYVSAPELKTVYDGTVVLDRHGEADVELPEWFSKFHGDFRYQLTAIGEAAQIYIAEEVTDGHFKIAGGYSEQKVSWQITGVKRDPYALSRPLVVETLKEPVHRGRFLHPEAYGRPPVEGLNSIRSQTVIRRGSLRRSASY